MMNNLMFALFILSLYTPQFCAEDQEKVVEDPEENPRYQQYVNEQNYVSRIILFLKTDL